MFWRWVLISLIAFLSIGAIYGGLTLIIQPDGSGFGMPIEILANSPFGNFLIPGIILLCVFGLFPVFVVYSLIKKPDFSFAKRLNLLTDIHFSVGFSVYLGLGQIIWIDIQTWIFDDVEVIHMIYSGLGIAIASISMLPSIRNYYKIK